jgi:hypothetical protein
LTIRVYQCMASNSVLTLIFNFFIKAHAKLNRWGLSSYTNN